MKIIPISSNTKHINNSRIAVNLLLKDKVSYVSLLPNRVTIIPIKLLKTQIGSINNDIMSRLRAMVTDLNMSVIPESKAESSNNSDPIIIFKKDMDSMKPYIENSNKILNDMISKKSLVLNIIIAVITGIVASLITNYIWLVLGLGPK